MSLLGARDRTAGALARARARRRPGPSSTPRSGPASRSSLDDRRVERPQSGRERRRVDPRRQRRRRPTSATSTASPSTTCCALADSVAQALRQEARERGALPSAVQPRAGIRGRRAARGRRRPSARSSCCARATRRRAPPAPTSRRSRANYAEARRVVEVFNSDGLAAADDRTRVRLGVQVVARRGDRVETGHETRGGHAASSCSPTHPEEVAEAAARKALTALDAVDAPDGPDADRRRERLRRRAPARGGRPRARGRRGPEARERLRRPAGRQAGRGVRRPPTTTAACRASGAATRIDDEGTPTQQTTIIDGGRLTSYLYDLLRARKDGARRPATAGASRSATCRCRA